MKFGLRAARAAASGFSQESGSGWFFWGWSAVRGLGQLRRVPLTFSPQFWIRPGRSGGGRVPLGEEVEGQLVDDGRFGQVGSSGVRLPVGAGEVRVVVAEIGLFLGFRPGQVFGAADGYQVGELVSDESCFEAAGGGFRFRVLGVVRCGEQAAAGGGLAFVGGLVVRLRADVSAESVFEWVGAGVGHADLVSLRRVRVVVGYGEGVQLVDAGNQLAGSSRARSTTTSPSVRSLRAFPGGCQPGRCRFPGRGSRA